MNDEKDKKIGEVEVEGRVLAEEVDDLHGEIIQMAREHGSEMNGASIGHSCRHTINNKTGSLAGKRLIGLENHTRDSLLASRSPPTPIPIPIPIPIRTYHPFPPNPLTSNPLPLILLIILSQQLILIWIHSRVLAPSPRKAIPCRVRPTPIPEPAIPTPSSSSPTGDTPPQTPHQQRYSRHDSHYACQGRNRIFDPRTIGLKRASTASSRTKADTTDLHAAVPVLVNPVANTTCKRGREQDDEHEEPEAAEAMGRFFFFEVFFVAGAGFGVGNIELPAAMACGQWDAAVAGRIVEVGLVRILLALEFVIRRGKTRY